MSKIQNRARGVSVHQTWEAQARVSEPVHEEEDEPWRQGASLTMPPPRPGQDQRWIRASMAGQDDTSNWSRKQREGWRPRPAETVSEDFPVPRIDSGRFAGCVGVEGLILCERPMALSRRRENYFAEKTGQRTAAIHRALDKFNAENVGSGRRGFHGIQMAERSVPMREVKVREDADD
ncbi:MAG: hypothetical protein IT514_15430 [Burkholderiales bacterium]|nr:hypothetical protein [Burkholderiales bacterium]